MRTSEDLRLEYEQTCRLREIEPLPEEQDWLLRFVEIRVGPRTYVRSNDWTDTILTVFSWVAFVVLVTNEIFGG